MAIAIIITYLLGCYFSFQMLMIEHKSEGQAVTIGVRNIAFLFALGSWIVVLWRLIAAWIKVIAKTNYWDKPVKEQPITETVKEATE